MEDRDTSRICRPGGASAVLLCVAALFCTSLSAAGSRPQQYRQQPAPIERRPPPQSASRSPAPAGGFVAGQPAPLQRRNPGRGPRGEHLAEWMSQHSNLSADQQQQALGREPGFSNLPPQTQQRYRDRLAQLNAMNPQKRERVLANTEAMERLTLPQRAEVRGALGQLGALPPEQRTTVARTFRALRDLPPEQRIPALNSGRFGAPLDDVQRGVLYNLLHVEPMLSPPSRPSAPVVSPPPLSQGWQSPR